MDKPAGLQDFNYAIALLAALERNPDGSTISTVSRKISNRELAVLIRNYAAHLVARGVDRDWVVVIAMQSATMTFAAAIAAGLLGVAWTPLHADLPVNEFGKTIVLYTGGRPGSSGRYTEAHEVDASWARTPEGSDGAAITFPGFSAASSIAYYSPSSGTTGRAKFVARDCQEVVDMAGVQSFAGLRAISMLAPVHSSITFRWMVYAALEGVRVVLPQLRADGVGEVAEMQQAGVDFVVGSPAQIDSICTGVPPLQQRIGTVRAGGAVVQPRALRHWFNYFDEVKVLFASRESGGSGVCSLRSGDDIADIAYTPLPNCEVQVVTEDGVPLAHSTTGLLRLRTPITVSGYVGNSDASSEVFRDGWFYPGDLAEMTEDGRFRIMGRAKDQMNLGGVKFNAADVDEAARSVEHIVDAVAFTTPGPASVDRLAFAAVLAPVGDQTAAAAAIRAACHKLNRSIFVEAVYFVEALPMNENGKRVRAEMPGVVADRAPY